MQGSPGKSRLVVFFFCSSDKSRNNKSWHLFLTNQKIFLKIFLWLGVFAVCILSITQISFKLIVLLLFQFPVVRMTQWVRDFVAWTIFCIENCFRSLFQDFLERPPSLAFFFFFALPSLSFRIFCKHVAFVRLWLWVLDSLFLSVSVEWYSGICGPVACGNHLRRHLLSVLLVLALSPFP